MPNIIQAYLDKSDGGANELQIGPAGGEHRQDREQGHACRQYDQ